MTDRGGALSAAPPELRDLRCLIDGVDDRLIDLVAQRIEIARRVAACKQRHGIAARLPERIRAVTERCAEAAAQRGVDPDYVRQLWAIIIEQTCRLEEQLIEGGP